VRLDFWQKFLSFFLFQSTHPRGVRFNDLMTYKRNRSFNPRTRVGCDAT